MNRISSMSFTWISATDIYNIQNKIHFNKKYMSDISTFYYFLKKFYRVL